MIVCFAITLKNQSKQFSLPADSLPTWERLRAMVVSRFHLPDNTPLRLQYHCHGATFTCDHEPDMEWFWQHVCYWSDEERLWSLEGMKEGMIQAEVVHPEPHKVEEEDEQRRIDIRVGANDIYRIFSFPSSSPPSLSCVLQQAESAFIRTGSHNALLLVEEGGIKTLIENEEQWREMGWKKAVAVFEKGRKEGDQYASTFRLTHSRCAPP
jgi:hypothetical protein